MKRKNFEQVLESIRGKRILVANRGIPARRIVRSIREVFNAVPIMTVTDVDKTAPFTSGAHELLLLGENTRAYLDMDLIISLAKARDICAIHPGWGFMSEDDSFPAKCEQAGILFIGPSTEAMRILGNKVEVRALAQKLGIPVVPGSQSAVSVEEGRQVARELGFPIMLKAEGGGGGRGIYEVFGEEQLEKAFSKASALAQASFGNPRLYVERLLTSVRHLEIQVVADHYGNVFTFDERDCTVQRKHQKLVEITPTPWTGMTQTLRNQLKQYAENLIREVGYYSLATVEFLVDRQGNPYLIEANTRLQVEHGITECRYGIDLVEEQIAIAFGASLRFDKKQTLPFNHAMQVRINCEDPQSNFAPNAGLITRYISPGGQGIRLDSCVSSGYEFPSEYDSAASLLIAYGKTWPKVLGIMDRALREYIVSGVKTTIPFHLQIIDHPAFRAGDFDTNFIAKTPVLLTYQEREAEHLRLSRLVAEISARGYNPFVQLGEYRGRNDKRIGRFIPVIPEKEREKERWEDGEKGEEFHPSPFTLHTPPVYPRGDRQALLDYVRDSGYVHFTDTTCRDITQSNSGNRFRLAEDLLIGPYLDRCGFFSLENGGGAHFHVAMMANMTYPFGEAREWNRFAPNTPKQILIRSTNVLGYKPQPKNLMRLTGEMICEHYDVIRCFDFLNHIESMRPFAEVVLNSSCNVFEPAISLSWARGFDVPHYLGVMEKIVDMMAEVSGLSRQKVTAIFILGLKDMAGVCPPRFMKELVSAIRKRYPDLVMHYHRHYTDGLFVPAVGAAVEAGAQIVDTGLGPAVRWYGQGDVLATAAYIEGELGLTTNLNKEMIQTCGFILKQIMPYYDRYAAPYFQGIDHEVVLHGMPGGATSSSQEGALKQNYIHLLPSMLRFLAGTRNIIRYHDVTPGSQITWNTAFLAVTSAFKRGGEPQVRHLLGVLEKAVDTLPADSAQAAATKVDTPQADTAQAAATKADTLQADTAQVAATKVDTPQADTAQAAATKVDTPQADTAQADTAKADTPQLDTPQLDTPAEELSEDLKKERLILYRESNDALRQLLLGQFGPLPLGFPPDWVYESAFGSTWKEAIAKRTESSPLASLEDVDIESERRALASHLDREPSNEELVMYLNHPGDALKTIQFQHQFGDPNQLPLDVWFEGLVPNQELYFNDSDGKPHLMSIVDISAPGSQGLSLVRYTLDGEYFTHPVKVAEALKGKAGAVELADKNNPYHVASPSNGDLWIMYVNAGDMVKKGEELFNITIMKQEKAVLSPLDAIVKRILKFANYKEDKKMVPVREGELIVELGPIALICKKCSSPVTGEGFKFCPNCGEKVE
jgi:pyruvate carboxylase